MVLYGVNNIAQYSTKAANCIFHACLDSYSYSEYGDIAEQLKVHASQELAHALEVAKQIDYLGADPTIKGKEAEFSQDSKTMLEIDLRAEQETIKNYSS